MIKEFCAENFTHIRQAINNGANRIELCDNLAEGGTTPSVGVLRHTLKYTQSKGVPVMVMIRPRGGDFVYSEEEFEMMKMDMLVVKDLGAEGVVFGCLTDEGRINRDQTLKLIKKAGDLETVFHMAFDYIHPDHRLEDLKWLIEQGVTRILTHGGIGGSVFDHEETLQEILHHARGRIEILIGGGITTSNAEVVRQTFSVEQLHGTKIVSLD